MFEIAAAYAYHIAEAQSCLDGNKRTAIACALIFLECNGIETTGIDSKFSDGSSDEIPVFCAARH